MWTFPRAAFSAWSTGLIAKLTALGVMTAHLAGLSTRWTGLIAMACSFTAVPTCRIGSSARGLTDVVVCFNNLAINSDLALMALMRALVPTSQSCSTNCWTRMINA